MIYINLPAPEPQSHHLHLVRRNLAIALDKNNRLTELVGQQAERIIELETDNAKTLKSLEYYHDELETAREMLHKAEARNTSEKWWSIERLRIINDKQAHRIAELTEEVARARDRRVIELATKNATYIDQIAELTAELEDAHAENVRLTGQVHALHAKLEQAAIAA